MRKNTASPWPEGAVLRAGDRFEIYGFGVPSLQRGSVHLPTKALMPPLYRPFVPLMLGPFFLAKGHMNSQNDGLPHGFWVHARQDFFFRLVAFRHWLQPIGSWSLITWPQVRFYCNMLVPHAPFEVDRLTSVPSVGPSRATNRAQRPNLQAGNLGKDR